MRMVRGSHARLTLAALLLPLALSATAQAAEYTQGEKMWLACENGRNYPIRPVGVSRDNDLVTGYFVWSAHGIVRLRLVPMGVGYRYTGGGIWFDGLRDQAVLNWGRADAVPCKVMQE
jgi:hypothetical protein